MREILFRGQCFDTKKWIYGSLLENDIIVTKGAVDVDKDYIGFSDEWSSVLPETIGQFIGLTDKNGTKIFEGDIIQYSNIIENGKGKVVFENCGFYFDWIDKNEFNSPLGYYQCSDELKVIGNIHDNPELLGGKTK